MTIQVGLIGYGMSGAVFHAPLIRHVEGMELAAVVSSKPDKVLRDHPGVEVLATPEDCSPEGMSPSSSSRLPIPSTTLWPRRPLPPASTWSSRNPLPSPPKRRKS